MAETANSAKWSLSWAKILDERVVFAILIKSLRNKSWSFPWSTAAAVNASMAVFAAILYPSMMVCGWIFLLIKNSPSLKSSAANTVTEVVPSPTSSSCTFDKLTNTFAAGMSNGIDCKMVAPSLVIKDFSTSEELCNNLSIPFGPNVDFTRSPTPIAPTNDEIRAFSALSSVAWSPKMFTDMKIVVCREQIVKDFPHREFASCTFPNHQTN